MALHPVGPLPAAHYWRRRAVLGVVVLLVLLLLRSCIGGGAANKNALVAAVPTQTPTQAATPTASPTPAPTVTATPRPTTTHPPARAVPDMNRRGTLRQARSDVRTAFETMERAEFYVHELQKYQLHATMEPAE